MTDLKSLQSPLKEKYRTDQESSRITLRAEGGPGRPEATEEQLRTLREKTDQYWVVMQTLTHPPGLRVEWGRPGSKSA